MTTGPAQSAPETRQTLSIAERARLTTGADLWCTLAEPRLGLPSLRMSDGPNGVRGSRFDERIQAWCTPCGPGLAATWDVELVEQVGGLLGDEALRMQVDVLLGPTVNLHRSPLGGRGFECYSEDPHLAGRIAAAWIAGVQSRGVAACPKHFVGNDSETSRTTVNCVIDERALRELYLVPFEHAVRAGAWTLMAAYNQVNGTFAAEHRGLLRDLLKDEWRWDGLLVSDWGAAHDTVRSALAGLDLEMPRGPALGASLGAAVEAGQVPEAELDDKVDRLLRLARRVRGPARGQVAGAHPTPTDSSQDQRWLLTLAAAGSFVLLKNDADLLPLRIDPEGGPLAVLGPNAYDPCFQGGGSAWVNTGELRDPIAVLTQRYDGVVTVAHERGCVSRTSGQPLPLAQFRTTGAAPEPGLTLSYRADHSDAAESVTEVRQSSFLSWHDGIPAFTPGQPGEVVMTAWWTPELSGEHTLSVRGSGATSISVDGQPIASLAAQAEEHDQYAALYSREVGLGSVVLSAGRAVRFKARMRHTAVGIPVLEVGCRQPETADLLDRAVRLARRAQAVILVVGTSLDVEAEGTDRTTDALPGDQDALIEAVLTANPRTVVVINSGFAVQMPWISKASTVLYTWLPGHGFADALAGVVAGDLEPGGRLPLTLATTPGDHAAYDTRPDADRRLVYEESVFVGYRHLTAQRRTPAFPFGHGLGYTRFTFGSLELSAAVLLPGAGLTATVPVTNVGARAGKVVVQAYVSPAPCDVPRPPIELVAFSAATLAAGETRSVALELDARAFAYWDTTRHAWRIAPGPYGVHVGSSSQDLPRSSVVVAAEHVLPT